MATLEELETFWSLDDLKRAIAILDMRQDLAAEKNRRSELVNSSRTNH